MAETLQESLKPLYELSQKMEEGGGVKEEQVNQTIDAAKAKMAERFSKEPQRLEYVNKQLESLKSRWLDQLKELKDAEDKKKLGVLFSVRRNLDDATFEIANSWAHSATDDERADEVTDHAGKKIGIPDYEGSGGDNPTRWMLSGFLTAMKRHDFHNMRIGKKSRVFDKAEITLGAARDIYDTYAKFGRDHRLDMDNLTGHLDPKYETPSLLNDNHPSLGWAVYIKELADHGFSTFPPISLVTTENSSGLGPQLKLEAASVTEAGGLATETIGYLAGYLQLVTNFEKKDQVAYKEKFFSDLTELWQKYMGKDRYQKFVERGKKMAEDPKLRGNDTESFLAEKAYEISKWQGTDDYKQGQYELYVLQMGGMSGSLESPDDWIEKQVGPTRERFKKLKALATNLKKDPPEGLSLTYNEKTETLVQKELLDITSTDEKPLEDAEKDVIAASYKVFNRLNRELGDRLDGTYAQDETTGELKKLSLGLKDQFDDIKKLNVERKIPDQMIRSTESKFSEFGEIGKIGPDGKMMGIIGSIDFGGPLSIETLGQKKDLWMQAKTKMDEIATDVETMKKMLASRGSAPTSAAAAGGGNAPSEGSGSGPETIDSLKTKLIGLKTDYDALKSKYGDRYRIEEFEGLEPEKLSAILSLEAMQKLYNHLEPQLRAAKEKSVQENPPTPPGETPGKAASAVAPAAAEAGGASAPDVTPPSPPSTEQPVESDKYTGEWPNGKDVANRWKSKGYQVHPDLYNVRLRNDKGELLGPINRGETVDVVKDAKAKEVGGATFVKIMRDGEEFWLDTVTLKPVGELESAGMTPEIDGEVTAPTVEQTPESKSAVEQEAIDVYHQHWKQGKNAENPFENYTGTLVVQMSPGVPADEKLNLRSNNGKIVDGIPNGTVVTMAHSEIKGWNVDGVTFVRVIYNNREAWASAKALKKNLQTREPSPPETESPEAVDLYHEHWKQGKNAENPFENYTGTLVVQMSPSVPAGGKLNLRSNGGKIVAKIENGTEVIMTHPDVKAWKVDGVAFVRVTYYGKDYWVSAKALKERGMGIYDEVSPAEEKLSLTHETPAQKEARNILADNLRQNLMRLVEEDAKLEASGYSIQKILDDAKDSLTQLKAIHPDDPDIYILEKSYQDLRRDFEAGRETDLDESFELIALEMNKEITASGVRKISMDNLESMQSPSLRDTVARLKTLNINPSYVVEGRKPNAKTVVLFMQRHPTPEVLKGKKMKLGSSATASSIEDALNNPDREFRTMESSQEEIRESILKAYQAGFINTVYEEGLPRNATLPKIPQMQADKLAPFLRRVRKARTILPPQVASIFEHATVQAKLVAGDGLAVKGYDFDELKMRLLENKADFIYRVHAHNAFIASYLSDQVEASPDNVSFLTIGGLHEAYPNSTTQHHLPLSHAMAYYGMNVVVVDTTYNPPVS